MSMTKLTVIIPVYKVEKYIGQCVGSVINQSSRDFEVVLVDDGSPDRCPEICDSYAEKYPYISVIHQKNQGLSAARNAGIAEAKGEYLLFLDSDDHLIGNNAVDLIIGALNKTNPDVLLYSEIEYDGQCKNEILRHDLGDLPEGKIYNADEIIDEIYRGSILWITQCVTKIIRREFLLDNKLTFEGGVYHEDDEWTAKVFLSNPRVSILKKHLYAYRHRDDSIMSATNSETNFRKQCDRVKIGVLMLAHPNAKRHKAYMEYASEYFLNGVLAAAKMDEPEKSEFLSIIKPYRRCCKKVIHTKKPKRILKAAYPYFFGFKKFVSHYKRKLS